MLLTGGGTRVTNISQLVSDNKCMKDQKALSFYDRYFVLSYLRSYSPAPMTCFHLLTFCQLRRENVADNETDEGGSSILGF